MNSVFSLQFSYFLFTWTCHNRTAVNKTSKLHERCPQIVYSDKEESFKELLENDKFVSVHIKNLQFWVRAMFKVYNYISSPYRETIISIKIYEFLQLNWPNVRSLFCGTKSISLFGSKIWNFVPNESKKETLDAFKKIF